MIFGKFSLNKLGVVRATVETPSTTGIVNGAAYLDDEQGDSYACVSTAAVNAADGFIGGFRYTTAGALRVSDVTAGIPASNSINQGILMTDNGQVCFSGAAGTATINGVSVTADGAVSMQVMAFLAEFEDLGAGAVDTAVTFGNVAATFTRATTATTISRTGLVISVATGVARSYYDPTSLAYLGYLAEGARTNICLQSEDLGTTWANVNSTESVNAGVAPDGATTADKLIPNAAAVNGQVIQSGLTLTADQTYTFSVFAKTSGFDSLQLRLADATVANAVNVTYNTTTGAVESAAALTGAWTAASSTAKQYSNGWWRFSVTVTCTTNAGDRCALINTDTGDGANGVLLWGMQIENAAFASSYIPTTTAAVARNADVLTYPDTVMNSGTDSGTWYAEFQLFSVNTTLRHEVISTTGAGNNRWEVRGNSESTTNAIVAYGTGSAVVSLTAGTVAINTSYQIAAAYGATGGGTSLDGATAVTSATASDLGADAAVGIGCSNAGLSNLFGPIRRVAYYPSRLPNATLQSLTA